MFTIKEKIEFFLIGIKNIWKFRKVIYNFRSWDYQFNMDILRESFKHTEKYMRKTEYFSNETADDIAKFLELSDPEKDFRSPRLLKLSNKKWEKVNVKDLFVKVENTDYYQMVEPNTLTPEENDEYNKLILEENENEKKRYVESFNILKNMQEWWV